jgi:SAM-dependent methyltransferase
MRRLERSTRRLISIIHRLQRSLSQRGYLGSLRHAYRKVRLGTRRDRPAGVLGAVADREFDRAHHVETAAPVPMYQLDIQSDNWRFAVNYYPIDPAAFRAMLAAAGIDYPRFTFVDLGAGKGRALLLASEYPFAKIIGVEFSPELVEIARNNLRSYTAATQRCANIEVRCMDVVDFPIPDGPVVFFLYNPFEEPVLGRVAERIRQSLEAHPRDAIIIYDTPEHDELWGRVGALKQVTGGVGYSIYKTGPLLVPAPAR